MNVISSAPPGPGARLRREDHAELTAGQSQPWQQPRHLSREASSRRRTLGGELRRNSREPGIGVADSSGDPAQIDLRGVEQVEFRLRGIARRDHVGERRTVLATQFLQDVTATLQIRQPARIFCQSAEIFLCPAGKLV